MTTGQSITELTRWLTLMNHDPEDSTSLEDAVVEAIDALKAVQRAALASPGRTTEEEKNDQSRSDQPQLRACESDQRGDQGGHS